MKLLIVDDDAFLRDMYVSKFEEAGHTADVAKSAEQALETLAAGTYDVVLLDMIMPGMGGVEMVQKIKTGKLGGEPICIVLSNQSTEEEIHAAMNAGAQGYIIKAELIPSEVVAKVTSIASS